MLEFVIKIVYMIITLPFIMLLEGSKMFADFLKKRNIYLHWDIWHSYLVVLVIALIVLWANGFRP